MSLPESFADAETYFAAAVEFLREYSWIYRNANTSCLKSLEEMPDCFQNFFLNLTNESLNTFPFVHEPLDGCPEEVLSLRKQIAQLTPKPTAAPSSDVDQQQRKRNCKMAPKKQHEIEKLAAHIHGHCPDTKFLVDLGSGLGYLGEALMKRNENYLILGLEADEQRVQTARKRSRELLPKDNSNSIRYEQLFITEDASCSARIEEGVAALAEDNDWGTAEGRTALIGLHACADLSISAMRLFLALPQVSCLHIMPCCYHKLALSEDAGTASSAFRNFPLSKPLREAMSHVEPGCFHRPFMRLACQQTKSRWQIDAEAHEEHGRQMFWRGLAEALCHADECSRVRRSDKSSLESFDDVQQRFQLHSRLTDQPLDWRPVHRARFEALNQRYAKARGPKLAEALCCLQTSIQLLCENLVLYDRLCYLEELAAARQLRVHVRYEKLFDEQLSPRCHVLIAEKL